MLALDVVVVVPFCAAAAVSSCASTVVSIPVAVLEQQRLAQLMLCFLDADAGRKQVLLRRVAWNTKLQGRW